jgi:parallel beta-helix repeat protein
VTRIGAGLIAGVLALCIAGAMVAPAGAKTIHVRAKKDDAIAKAIDRANPGDRLVVHKGMYKDPVVVDQRVRIVGKKKRHGRKSKKPVIATGCGVEEAVEVTADGTRLRRLKIRGGFEYSVDMSLIESGSARQLRVIDTCDALYGINVFNSGPLQLLGNRTSGYLDAGIYVGGITNTAADTLLIAGNDSFGNNRGLIVEDSFLPTSHIRVADNRFHDNTIPQPPGVGPPSGIFVHNSDHVTFVDNLAEENGVYGIDIDATSNENRLFDNVFLNNPTNVRDLNGDNCGSGNSPNPFPAC